MIPPSRRGKGVRGLGWSGAPTVPPPLRQRGKGGASRFASAIPPSRGGKGVRGLGWSGAPTVPPAPTSAGEPRGGGRGGVRFTTNDRCARAGGRVYWQRYRS